MTQNTATFEFLNHAGFLLEYGDVTLAVDPWLFGDAFNRGWDLLSPSAFTATDFERVSHIWISHEHPDHFNVGVLQAIPQQIREQITIFFQSTRDRRVLNFCEHLGFRTRELVDQEWLELAPGFRLQTGKVPLYDVWLLVEIAGKKLLNVNDCILENRGMVEQVQKLTGVVDLLMTQFGYANWAGNPDEPQIQKDLAEQQLRRIAVQIEVIKPRQVIPFASYIRFNHEENAYLTEHNNKIRKVAEHVRECGAAPVVLYPGDRWWFDEARDNEPAIEKYEADLAAPVTRHSSTPVAVEDLMRGSENYLARIRERNNRMLIALLAAPPLRFFAVLQIALFDQPDRAFRFDIRNGLREVESTGFIPEITLHSESLAFVFAFEYGVDTLLVNGRFRASQKNYWKMLRTFSLGSLNNGGRALSFRLATEFKLIWWAFLKLYFRHA